ncbi:MAG: hypothetical protein IH986_05595 [Planctomycetes bacterium]|nr:hypothetical protein [Planctomycetota bacterium]
MPNFAASKPLLLLALACVLGLGPVPPIAQALGQDRPATRDEARRSLRRGARKERGGRGFQPRRGGPQSRPHRGDRRRSRMPGLLPGRPSEADRGPLQPGEDQELLAFARERVPDVYRLLKRFQERNPRQFREKLGEFAPWLRQLRRVFANNPALGDLIVQHAENDHRIRRGVRAWHRARDKPDVRGRMENAIRERVAKNLRLDCQILDLRAEQLEEHGETWTDERLARLLDPERDLAAEPPRLREVAEAYRTAEADEEREELREQLRLTITEQLEGRIAGMRSRATRIREHGAEEVDRRVDRMLQPRPGRRPGQGKP